MCNRNCFTISVKKLPFCSMFTLGFVFCANCETYLYREDCKKLRCPCCRFQVRTSPRSKKSVIMARIWKLQLEKKDHLNLQLFKMKRSKKHLIKFIKKKDWKAFECYYCKRLFKFYIGLCKHMTKCPKLQE